MKLENVKEKEFHIHFFFRENNNDELIFGRCEIMHINICFVTLLPTIKLYNNTKDKERYGRTGEMQNKKV